MVNLLSRRSFLAASAGAAALAVIPQRASAQGLGDIVRVAIHPGLGVARVGNSRDAFYFGPEIPGGIPEGPYKDADGAMAKQAARFRVYGYDRDGRVVRELTADEAEITWTVRVGNAKAAWYGADEPLTCPRPRLSPSAILRSRTAEPSRCCRARARSAVPAHLPRP